MCIRDRHGPEARRADRVSEREPFTWALPFTGRWIVQNSPASRVPSHGTELFGNSHATEQDGRGFPLAFLREGEQDWVPRNGEIVAV